MLLSFLGALLFAAHVSSLTQPSLENLQATIPLDFDLIPFQPKLTSDLRWERLTGKYNSTGRDYSAYAARFATNFFSFYPPTSAGCDKLVKPSESSVNFKCEYATNGAFFKASDAGYCVGNLISDSYIWQLPEDGSGVKRANFGVTADHQVLVGFVDSPTIASTKFTQLITGWGWLVRNGVSYVQNSSDLSFSEGGFTLEKAPRTAVGVFKDGSMILLEIDGEEDILAGPDLFEVAELLVSLGVEAAVNIDGGGSAVSVNNGVVISEPTCKDTPEICERADASITCVRASLRP